MEFSRQEHWSGLPYPSPGDLPDPEIEPRSPALQADSLPSEPAGKGCMVPLCEASEIWSSDLGLGDVLLPIPDKKEDSE